MNKEFFEEFARFQVIIPKHGILTRVHKAHRQGNRLFEYLDSRINQNNFPPSRLLHPGQKKNVIIYRVLKSISHQRVIDSIASAKLFFPNAQGLAILWGQHKESLPMDHWIFGHDKVTNLYLDEESDRLVPYLLGLSDKWHFYVALYSSNLEPGEYVVTFEN